MKDYWNKCKRYLLAYLSDDSNSLYQVGRKIVPIVRNCTVVLILLLVYFVLYGSCTVLKEYRITELVFNYSYPDLLIVVVLF